MLRYILNGHDPVPEPDLHKWAEWFEEAERHVAFNEIGCTTISTVFLGLDHSFGNGSPILFETLVFGGVFNGYMERYASWDEAVAGHERVLKSLRPGRGD